MANFPFVITFPITSSDFAQVKVVNKLVMRFYLKNIQFYNIDLFGYGGEAYTCPYNTNEAYMCLLQAPNIQLNSQEMECYLEMISLDRKSL